MIILFIKMKQQIGLQYYKLKVRYWLWREKVIFLHRVSITNPLRVVIGSSGVFDPDWIPSNYQYLNLLVESHWQRAFGRRKISSVLAEHVWEHLDAADGLDALLRVYRYMEDGARLRLAVPDGYSPNPAYIEMVKPGGSGEGCDDHKLLYNVDTLEKIMLEAGFHVERLEYYDSEGKFHRFPWSVLDGMVHRSMQHDQRNVDNKIVYTSLILDGYK